MGKTSLIRRFVLDVYGDAYVKTVGTKVTRRDVLVFPPGGRAVNVNLVVWDIMGNGSFRDVLQEAYFAGARGVLAVSDLTRALTLPALRPWIETARRFAGNVPVVVAGNKSDLAMPDPRPASLSDFARDVGAPWMATSAKTGANVLEAFRRLALAIAARPRDLREGPDGRSPGPFSR